MALVSVFGQMNVDMIFGKFHELPELGEEAFSKSFDLQLGGGPMVAPIVLSRLGYDAKLGTFLSQDNLSFLSKKMLEDVGFQNYTNFYNGSGHPVVATSVLSFERDRSFICYNEEIRESLLEDEVVYRFLKDSKVAFAPQGKVDVLKKLKENGVTIIFDTGWHNDLHIDMFEETLKYVDVFTPNDKEAMKMTGTSHVEDAVKALATYVKHPIVSIGEKGCLTYLNDEIRYVSMPKDFHVVDTTGAGDNFLTGIIYGLLKDVSIIECMEYGNIFGGLSTEALGCYKADITLEKVSALKKLY